MFNLSPEIISFGMLSGVLIAILSGYPICYMLGIVGFLAGYLVFQNQVVYLFYNFMYSTLTNYSLMAIPLFVFMGAILQHSGIVERVYHALYMFLGQFRGGLAVVTILLGIIVAATVGVFAASITILALVSLPPMIKRGYSKRLATGAVTAGGLLGILIPPSIMLIIYGPMANISVGKLFFATIVPGLLIGFLYIAYISLRCLIKPELAPSISKKETEISFNEKLKLLLFSLVPTVILILSVLGAIFFGIAPPTEAAGIGALVAVLLSIAYRSFNFKLLVDASVITAKMSGFAFLIIGLSVPFGSVLIASGGGDVVTDLIMSVPGDVWGAFFVMIGIVFLLGLFVEWIAILYIVVPIMTPIAKELGFDPLWFATMVCIAMQMGYMTPPMSMGVFVCKAAAPPELHIEMSDIIRGTLPHVFLVMLAILLCCLFPGLITYLPGKMM